MGGEESHAASCVYAEDPYALNILALRPKLAISQGHKHNIGSKCDKLGEEPFS